MLSPTRQRPARLSLVPGICTALALVVGAYAYAAENTDKASASRASSTDNQVSIGPGSRLASRGGGNTILGGCPASFCAGGVCTLTQSLDLVTNGENQIACADIDTGNTTPNGWARCYNLVAEGVPPGVNLTINSVTFGVQQATIDGINIDVVLYLDCNGCPPGEPGFDALVLATQSLVVDMADEGTMITVDFPSGPVVPEGSDLIVEIVSVDDGTVEPFFSFRAMSNDGGQCAPSYLRAADCGFSEWVDLADIGFPDAHLIQSVSATEGGVVTLVCPKIPESCGKGAGACGEANGSPGCDDVACCAAVCAIVEECCTVDWDAFCAGLAIDIGCALLPCPVSSCQGGQCTLTQSQNVFIDSGNQVACGFPDGTTTDNFWARCYNLVAEGVPKGENLTINSVTFGVAQATMDGINVAVTLYIDCDGCPPGEPGIDSIVLATQSLVVNMADQGSMITVNFPAGTVVPAGTDLIVEVGNVDNGFEQFAFRAMSNDVGQCGPSYLRSPCTSGWEDTADVGDGFPDSHLIQSVDASVGGVVTVQCLKACGKGTGPCGEPNGSPGCEDEACCALVCADLPNCCDVEWDQSCADLAVELGCAVGGPPANLATGPSQNVDGYLRIGTDDFGSWADPGFGGGLGDTFNPVGAFPAGSPMFAAWFSVYRQALGESEALSTNTAISNDSLCPNDETMTRAITSPSVSTDTNGDNVDDTRVSTWDLTSQSGMDTSWQLTQHVFNQTLEGGALVAIVTFDFVITNNGPPVDFILQRHLDIDSLFGTNDFADDNVGTGTNESKLDRFIYQGEQGFPEVHITLSSPQGDVYYGGKQGVIPDPGDPNCVAYDFGSDTEICENLGTPDCWKYHIAGVGYNTDGDSGPDVGDDGFIGMEIPISLAAEGVTTVSVMMTYGAKTPGLPDDGEPCPWDLDGSGSVGAADLLQLLFEWGPCPGCAADFDGDDIVGASDLLAMLFNWGPCP